MFFIQSRILLIALAVPICQVIATGQNPNGPTPGVSLQIHGQVRYTEGGAPAQNVLVRLESNDFSGFVAQVFTDRLGKFHFPELRPAQYSVIVHESGYFDAQQQVDLTIAASGYVLLQLSKDRSSVSSNKPAGIDANVPQSAQKEFDKGVAAIAEGRKEKISEGAKHLEKAISIYPRFVEARLKLGTAYMDLEQWTDAEKMLQATVELDPSAANALFALGEVYLQQQMLAEAEKALTQGLKIEDRSYFAHFSLARVYWIRAKASKELSVAKPDLEKAYEEVKHALQLKPDLPGAHLLKGNLLLRAGRSADALKEFDEYLRLEPKGQEADQTRELIEKIRKPTVGSSRLG